MMGCKSQNDTTIKEEIAEQLGTTKQLLYNNQAQYCPLICQTKGIIEYSPGGKAGPWYICECFRE